MSCNNMYFHLLGWGFTKPISSVPLFTNFSILSKQMLPTEYVTPVKYESDSRNLTGTFPRWKILFTEELTKGALATHAPGLSGHSGCTKRDMTSMA